MSDARAREASRRRQTGETDVSVAFNLDGEGACDIESGVPFLDHMLHLFAVHGRFDLSVRANGDTEIDDHHTVEDIAIVLGGCLLEALGDKRGIRRYGNAFVPMDETLAQVVVDVSNRPHLEYRAAYPSRETGRFQTELVHEFLAKLAAEGRIALHVIVHYGRNTHHMIEAVFKALGRALNEAASREPGRTDVPSTKGLL
ncbi:imidazoleglycerol-phosphate dehydratase HisB [Cohnella massiliensis]|uniref:imidazoleglycerol-phosphate dehydratase HisB n=1 Tax=Cohnella massiliensis TaxID=1816691 RepID=UPI0009BAB4FA|nr:imidazoleglycerol-phosphate dehydratase HisB [Cohnella massiliensis]